MKKMLMCLILLLVSLTGCKMEFDNPQNEIFTTVEQYNEFVRLGADDLYENYFFIDLRSRADYLAGFVSNFHNNYNLWYRDESDLELIIDKIEETNKAGFSAPIVLLDSGEATDNASSVVYEALVEAGYKNVKDVELGYKGLKEAYKVGYPYFLKNSNDCDC